MAEKDIPVPVATMVPFIDAQQLDSNTILLSSYKWTIYLKGGAFSELKLSKTELMVNDISWADRMSQRLAWVETVKIRGQDTTFGLGFKLTRKDC